MIAISVPSSEDPEFIEASLYDSGTGIITAHVTGECRALHAQIPSGCGLIRGLYNPRNRRIDIASGQVIPYQPPAPDADHVWDAGLEQWVIPPEVQAAIDDSESAAKAIDRFTLKVLHRLLDWAVSVGGGNAQALADLQQFRNQIQQLKQRLRP